MSRSDVHFALQNASDSRTEFCWNSKLMEKSAHPLQKSRFPAMFLQFMAPDSFGIWGGDRDFSVLVGIVVCL